jgi:hypothetical protein
MDNQHIKCLINELQILRICKIEEHNAINQAITTDVAATKEAATEEAVSPTASIETSTTASVSNRDIGASGHQEQYRVGDRVEITNKVRWLFNCTPIRRDCDAMVIGVADHRIDIVTDNSTETWRAPPNLRKLKKNE